MAEIDVESSAHPNPFAYPPDEILRELATICIDVVAVAIRKKGMT